MSGRRGEGGGGEAGGSEGGGGGGGAEASGGEGCGGEGGGGVGGGEGIGGAGGGADGGAESGGGLGALQAAISSLLNCFPLPGPQGALHILATLIEPALEVAEVPRRPQLVLTSKLHFGPALAL